MALPPAGTLGTVNFDWIRTRGNWAPVVGEVFDPDQVEDRFEIKTSIQGGIDSDQKTKPTNVMGGRKPIVTTSTRRWRAVGGWIVDRRFALKLEGLKTMKAVSGAVSGLAIATCAWAVFHSSQYDPLLFELEQEATRLQNHIANNIGGADLDGASMQVGFAMARYWSNLCQMIRM